MTRAKHFDRLTIRDFQKHPVWEFTNVETKRGGEMMMRPVEALPVATLANRIIGTNVTLHNGSNCWAILSNISLNDRHATDHFLTLSVENSRAWFNLARYHDVDHTRRGPAQLAEFLGLAVSEVFPIHYDISSMALGLEEVTSGLIPAKPPKKLSDRELIRLSLDSD